MNSHLCGLTTSESAAPRRRADPAEAGHHRRDAGVRRVDVQPDAARARRCRRSRRPDRRSSSTSCRPWPRRPSAAAAARSSSIARASASGACGTRRRPESAERVVAEAEQDDRLVDRRVRVLGAVDAQRRQVDAPGSPRSRTLATAFARGRERVQRRDRRRVVDDAFERRRAGRAAAAASRAPPPRARSPPGDVRHSIACTLSAADRNSARTPGALPEIAK